MSLTVLRTARFFFRFPAKSDENPTLSTIGFIGGSLQGLARSPFSRARRRLDS